MKLQYLLAACVACCSLSLQAQTTTERPTIEEMQGDYVLLHSKLDDDGTSHISEVRDFNLQLTSAGDSLTATGFYSDKAPTFNLGYVPTTGNIVIPAGTLIFTYGDGSGSIVYLYPWDELSQTVTMRPITYRYKGDGTWETSQVVVMMAGTVGGTDLTPYYLAQGSRIARANAVTENVTYDGDGTEWVEQRPSYITMDEKSLTVYNLIQTNAQGTGCYTTFAYNRADGRVLAYPQIIGEAPADLDYPYKALTGCTYDAATHRPTGCSYAGDANYEGLLSGQVDAAAGVLTLAPTAVWPAAYDATLGWSVNYDAFYEVHASIKVKFDNATVDAISSPQVSDEAAAGNVIRTEYYALDGRRLSAPQPHQFVIKRSIMADGTSRSEKVLQR